jgi:hypothetical protein
MSEADLWTSVLRHQHRRTQTGTNIGSAAIRDHLRENFNANEKEWGANGRESSPRWSGKNLKADKRGFPQIDADVGE